MLFAAVQPLHGFAESKIFNPAFFFVFFITDLIHDIKSITAFCIDRFKETHRILDSIKGIYDHFFFDTYFLGNFGNCRFFQVLLHIIFAGIDCFVCNITKRTADADAVVIPEISPDFAYDHWNCISGKFYL